MKQLLLICAVVALVGCGKATKEKGAQIKAAADDRAVAEKKATETATIPQQPKTTSEKLITEPIVEKAIREKLKKPTGELTKADYEKVTRLVLNGEGLTSLKGLEKLTQLKTLYLIGNQLTSVKELEKLTQLTWLNLNGNKLTDVKGLENLDQLKDLDLYNNPDLTKAQVDQLQKALLNCKIHSNPTK
tara:strand:- start:2405 stop:2968 length:564 start_codon:yes stop_codon:yes gene_type:complete